MPSITHRLIYRNITHSKAEGRFGKQDFRYAAEDVYMCPAAERLAYHYTNEENGLVQRRYPNVAYRHIADNSAAAAFVRYWSNSGHWPNLARDGSVANDPSRASDAD